MYKEFAQKHHFIDGNKRTAYFYAKLLLFTYKFYFHLEYKKSVKFILKIAKYNSTIKIEEITKWIKENCHIIAENDKVLESSTNH